MGVFFELGIVILISFLGVAFTSLTGLPIPGSVLAMVVFYLLLHIGIIKAEKISKACDFLGGNMGLFFIPLNVGIMVSYKLFAHKAFGVMVTVIGSTFLGVLCSYGGVVLVGKLLEGRRSNGNI